MAAQEKMLQVREDGVYTYVDQMPVYPKGQEGIMQYIAKTVKYPAYARAKGASGTVLVQFVIKKNGKTSQFEVVRGVDPLLDEEALRVVKGIPGKWVPKFFTEEDLEKGYIEVANRKGIIEQFSLTSISIGAVIADKDRFANILEIGEIGAQVKHVAKSIIGSSYAVDRRHE